MLKYLCTIMTVIGLLCTFANSPVEAQTRRTPRLAPDAWTFDVAPFYLWLPALEGDITIRGHSAPVDVSIGEFVETIFESFQFGFTGRFEARRGPLLFTLDILYLSFDEEDTGPRGLVQRDVGFNQFITEFGTGFRLGEWLLAPGSTSKLSMEVLGGGRYVNLDGELDIDGTGPLGVRVDVGRTVDWIEPFVGGRITLALSNTLALVVRGDVGGFGLGSNLTWALTGTLQYHLSPKVALTAGYRVLDIDYDEGSGTDRFVYNIISHGPGFGAVFRF